MLLQPARGAGAIGGVAGDDYAIEHAASGAAAKAVPAIPYFIQQARGVTVLMSVNGASSKNTLAEPSNRSSWRSELVDTSYCEGFENRGFHNGTALRKGINACT